KALACYYCLVVARPSSHHWVEVLYQPQLGRSSFFPDDLLQLFQMSVLGFLTGFDECFESQWCSIRRLSGSVFAYPVLAYLEPQEVESPISLMCFQCMSYSGFARLHFQADFPEPCFCPLFCLVDLLQGWAENDKVVRIAHDLGVGRQSAVVSL